jgi:hypothetical protein
MLIIHSSSSFLGFLGVNAKGIEVINNYTLILLYFSMSFKTVIFFFSCSSETKSSFCVLLLW